MCGWTGSRSPSGRRDELGCAGSSDSVLHTLHLNQFPCRDMVPNTWLVLRGAPMKVSLFYELQLPRPWQEDSEQRLYENSLAELELADQLGYHTVWVTEHHFQEEKCHLSCPEVLMGALTQRTKRIRIGHGIAQ